VPDVTVDIVSDLPPWPESTNPDDATYTEYDCAVNYIEDTGLEASPVAGPYGTPCDVVRLHGGRTYKLITWVTRRVGAKPVSPSTDTGSGNDVLLKRNVGAAFPGMLGSGEELWTVWGAYLYLMRVPPGPNDPLPIGSMPFDTVPGLNRYLQPGVDFSPTLHGPVTPPSGSLSEKLTF
jgi:hypothetical protein